MEKRLCRSCNKEKDLSEFRVFGRHKDKQYYRCKSCNYENFKRWKIENPEKAAAMQPDWTFERRCKRHRVSPEVIKHTYKEQEGKCVICTDQIQIDSCAIDHNHATKEFRGLLCKKCNSAIGFLKDKPDNLQRALNYLNERGHYGES